MAPATPDPDDFDTGGRPTFAGSLDVYGTWDAVFHVADADEYAWLLDPATPTRQDVRFAYRDSAGRTCPVCRESVTAVVFERVALVPSEGVREGGSVRFRLSGVDPAGLACEPCGHRFDRFGKESASA